MAVPAFNVLSTFSGYGGIELGLQLAGEMCGFTSRTVCYVERDAFAAANLVAKGEEGLLDEAPVWPSIDTFDASRWRGAVDLVTGGFQCQPWSDAGKRAGIEDERWLWPSLWDTIRLSGARFAFVENVPGIVAGGLEHILRDLAEGGFDAEWDVFSAADLGASQRRERFFMLAFTTEQRHERTGRAREGRYGPPDESGLMDNADDPRCPPAVPRGRGESESQRETLFNAWSPGPEDRPMGNADGPRPQRRGGSEPQGENELPAWPPGPEDRVLWARILEHHPEVEPAVCGLPYGLTDRVDRLRAGGNGVVPAVAAFAFITLARRAGVI